MQYIESMSSVRDDEVTVFVRAAEGRVVVAGKPLLVSRLVNNIAKKIVEIETRFEQCDKAITKKLQLIEGMPVIVGKSALVEYLSKDITGSVDVSLQEDFLVFSVSLAQVTCI